MPFPLSLGYLVLDVRRRERWTEFCRTMLGLQGPVTNWDGSLGWRMDGKAHRLILQQGPSDDLAALGLACADDSALERLAGRLAAAGVAVAVAAPELVASRRVRRLLVARDPMGNSVELHVGMADADRPFSSPEMSGYVTGDLGIGHAVLVAHDLAAMEDFYVGGLGFGVTERLATKVGPVEVRGTFLHCNRRYHSLALFQLPLRKRLHHFMLQAATCADVGRAFDRARVSKVPLSLGLGQHPEPDGTFSFYGQTPSGFDFEIGAGAQEIEPAGWSPLATDVTSAWGHKPSLRLKLKMARELALQKLAAAF